MPNKNLLKKILFPAGVSAVLLLALFFYWRQPPKILPADRGEELKSLPYAAWSETADPSGFSGVKIHDKEKVAPGFNFYVSPTDRAAFLFSNEGAPLHQWRLPPSADGPFHHAVPLGGGSILAIVRDWGLLKLDSDSNVTWVNKIRAHHDAAIAPDGRIFALHRRTAVMPSEEGPIPLLIDQIAVLDKNGEAIGNIDLFPLFSQFLDEKTIAGIQTWAAENPSFKKYLKTRNIQDLILPNDTPVDLYHVNSIEITDRKIDRVCEPGDLLISVRHLNRVFIIDPDSKAIRWEWGEGILEEQHDATLLENGRILLFDNGTERKASRVLEIDPRKKSVEWTYQTNPPEDFYSERMGGVQRLSNGNTLVTDSGSGIAFEIGPDKRPVWFFYNPKRRETTRNREVIYRLNRFSKEP